MSSSRKAKANAHVPAIERFSLAVMAWTGSTPALLCVVGFVVLWLLAGPVFGFSTTWQLVINTSTTIVTFLMVFLIQRGQNKDARAVSLKLDELIAALDGASNRLIDVESLSEADLETLRRHYQKLVTIAMAESTLTKSHSVEEAERRHAAKTSGRRGK